jgi:hypothetical protein
MPLQQFVATRDQGYFFLRSLRAHGAYKRGVYAVCAGEACTNSINTPKRASEAGQKAGERKKEIALTRDRNVRL